MRYNWNLMHWGNWGVFGTGLSLLLVWSLFWKGLALWRAAKENQKYWFIAFLFINTVGLLEIAYLFLFAKEKLTFGTAKKTMSGKKSKK